MMRNTNPFDDAKCINNVSHAVNGQENKIVGNEKGDVTDDAPSSLFPDWLSSWMSPRTPSDDGDDESLYHDCISYVDTMDDQSSSSSMEDESSCLLPKSAQHNGMAAGPISPLRQRGRANRSTYDATSTFDSSITPVVDNRHRRSSDAGTTACTDSVASPFAHALSTWLSPYADSARRAGRKMLLFSEEASSEEGLGTTAGETSILLEESDHANDTEGRRDSVRFHPDYKGTENGDSSNGGSRRNLGFLSRVNSSPALMTAFSDESSTSARRASLNDYSTIVLKDIVVEGDNSDTEDGAVIHPWTKLILLEELGTAWSWFVLLLPYFFMLLAVILDGDSTLRNTVIGPLNGTRTCAELVQGSVPTPFDASVKGFYPVPFRLKGVNETLEAATMLPGSCTYPFELREGVGLLSHAEPGVPNSTLPSVSSSTTSGRTSILDARYRYLMSHGQAWTSGVIPNVPPTSQSLRGSVSFNNLSSAAVSLVARGSVLVSVVVFQRQSPGMNSGRMANETAVDDNSFAQEWAPVLILTSKKLDMICQLDREEKHRAPTWTCSSRRIIDAFFSLPNTAVLMGGDLRVDILLSHHKTYKSLAEDLWFNERGGIMDPDDDYVIRDFNDSLVLSKADKILSVADVSHPQDLLAELSTKSVYKLRHESIAFNNVFEAIRIFALSVTLIFICYWCWCMATGHGEPTSESGSQEDASRGGLKGFIRAMTHTFSPSGWRNQNQQRFWWEDPFTCFPERRYLLLILWCLVMLQNPLLVYAFFHPSLYGSSWFRFSADSLSGISVHGILFLWLCLVHGLRYHTADIARRRLAQHRRVLELRRATRHISPAANESDDNQWGRVKSYFQEYGDVDGVGYSMALRMKHDVASDSFVEYLFPKITLLVIGVVASVMVAASRFPMSNGSIAERVELNPDRFGSGSKVYVVSSIVQLVVIQIWCLFIIYTSFVTGERLRREPFLSTRPAQLAFRVLSSILILGVGFSIALLYLRSQLLVGYEDSALNIGASSSGVIYDTSEGNSESFASKADIIFDIIRRASTVIPYVGSASAIGPGKILYATACSLVVAYIFLPSSHFQPSKREQQAADEMALGPDQYSKQNILSDKDKRLQGKDKRFVVALARNTHTWRVFPLPMRSHGLMSQHTLKEQLNIIGTFQLTGDFGVHPFKFGRGAIYKGKYSPVFCVEISCWLLEASWQAYYSPTEYSTNDWAPGRMRLDSIGLKLEHAIHDSETDTHGFVASNISEQVEGEDDSVIVVAFRGSASMTNVKTDLSFRQVPLPEKMMSDVPAFNVRPGMPVAIDETQWDSNESSSSSILLDILRQPSGKYSSWPTATTTTAKAEHIERDQSNILLPAVSSGAKAIIRATPMARQALPCVHEGFLEVYSKIRQEVIEAIISLLKRQLDGSVDRTRRQMGGSNRHDAQPLTLPKLYVTGHSMGGAIAQLLALDLASNCEIVVEQPIGQGSSSRSGSGNPSQQSLLSSLDEEVAHESLHTGDIFWLGQKLTHPTPPTKRIRLRPPIAVYTYGQPRVGNLAFKNIYKKRVPHTFRVATEGDAFTTMPTTGPCCGGIYRHAGLEVLLEEGCTGNILVGPTVVETLLRFTKVRTSMAAHSMDRYRESLESALGKEELKEYYRGHGGKVRHDRGLTGNGAALPSWVTSVKRSHDV